jgi:hypothetical protein
MRQNRSGCHRNSSNLSLVFYVYAELVVRGKWWSERDTGKLGASRDNPPHGRKEVMA